MITVNVNVIMFDTEYEFRLDQDALIGDLAEEIGEMICQREQCRVNGNVEHFVLFSRDKQSILGSNATLRDYGIKSGDTLYFC